MTLDEILRDIHALEEDLLNYERKYGVLSETFYESFMRGEEPPEESWVQDWNGWAATYEIWLQRKKQYEDMIRILQASTPLITVIQRAARREPLPLPG